MLIPFWLPIALAIAAFFIADCAANSPTGVCNALAAFVITVFIVVACVLGGFGGACWTSEAIPLDNPRPWWEDNRKWELPLPWFPWVPIPQIELHFASDDYPDPKFAEQLDRQLRNHGTRSICRSLRSLEKRLREHQDKLSDGLQYPEGVEREIETFKKQLETARRFIAKKGIRC